ncbi:pilus assembly protein TadG-related protein [Mesorhizobium sp. ES1-4]|uniref:pilus assembly protein TadG-related protein n=1 Tax=Mesorhizobium sp. ES1-4 TaxID=2876627 RepID=UPI001CCAD9A6|nr:pilus assembly protein TadG-related protein [Mesorhizobium sp. ES1-4]MBZ9799554.1 pilus assembly protein TadG-related protein [Mesorhizobium sp. ES1-4]
MFRPPFKHLLLFVIRLTGELTRNSSGNFALGVAVLAPLLLGTAGGGLDFLIYEHHKSELQDAADATALAAVREASMKGWSASSAQEIAGAVIRSNLSNRFSSATFEYTTSVNEEARQVTVTLSQDHYRYFLMGYFTGSPQITVSATARRTGQETICIIAQAPNGPEVLKIEGDADVSAPGCSAYAGSIDPKGLSVKNTSSLTTKLSCSVGGYAGSSRNYSPLPITDCPAISDPLASRASEIDGSLSTQCDFNKFEVKNAALTLSPGTYCQGLKISGGAHVTFSPGVYVIRNGELSVDGKSAINGSGIAFVFIGEKAVLKFANDSNVSLSAPEQGLMSGILIYARQVGNKHRDFNIQSRDAGRLIGTVYLPGDNLTVGGDKDGDGLCDSDNNQTLTTPVSEQCISDVGTMSAWTAIIAYKMHVTAGATLIINSNYASSRVPVPDGIGPKSGRIVLSQ